MPPSAAAGRPPRAPGGAVTAHYPSVAAGAAARAAPPPAAKKKAERPDKFVRHGRVLAIVDAREGGPEERMLAVLQLVFTYLCDILRPSEGIFDVPRPILGEHLISRRDIGPAVGGTLAVLVQEIATFDTKAQVASVGREGELRATMTVALRPWARTQGKIIVKSVGVELHMEGGALV